MTSRLQIRLGEVLLDVEGDPTLVLEVYRDFRDRIVRNFKTDGLVGPDAVAPASPSVSEDPAPIAQVEPREVAARRKGARRKRPSANGGEPRTEAYTPTMIKNLDLRGLPEFYAKFKPKSHSEKILIFAEFLKDKGHEPCTADQIFTCYAFARVERPKAFRQAIIDAHGLKHGFIDYKTVGDIRVTHLGEDHLNFHMAKAGE